MVIGSGRYATCFYCGQIFAEGDCRGWYCSVECQQKAELEEKDFLEKVKEEVAKAKP